MKNLFVAVILLLTVQLGLAQIVTIPDANFKNTLLNHNPVIDTNGDGEIQVSEAEDMDDTLFIAGKGIADLTGIEAFVNLYKIDCSQNQITSLDLTYHPYLGALECWQNQISVLDPSQSPNLRFLWCSNNQLTSLDVTNNPELRFFYPYNNPISSIDVTQNPELISFRCTDNLLTSLDVSQNPNLSSLDCWNNNLNSLDLSQNPNLQYLQCNNSQLTQLDIRNGNNADILVMWAYDNPNLMCIFVDDETATYPECDLVSFAGWCKDETTVYGENCALGISDFSATKIKLYPNPTTDYLNIEGDFEIASVQIYSLSGKIVKQSTEDKIDVSQLQSGLYFAKVNIGGVSSVTRFIKD